MTEKSLPNLNQQLREVERRLNKLDDNVVDIDLTSEVTGILPLANGGTGSDFSAIAEGDSFVGGGSNTVAIVGIGTSGYVWTSNGTTASWEDTTVFEGGLHLDSTTSFSGTNSGTISLSADNTYKIIFQATKTTGGAGSIYMVLDEDTGNNYARYEIVKDMDALTADAVSRSAATDRVFTAVSMQALYGRSYGEMEIKLTTSITVDAMVFGKVWYDLHDNAEGIHMKEFLTTYDGGDVASFTLHYTSGVTGTVWVYKYRT